MAQGKVIRLHPLSEEELRAQLREIGFGAEKIDNTVELIREETEHFNALDVVSVFVTPDGRVVLPEKQLETWRRNES